MWRLSIKRTPEAVNDADKLDEVDKYVTQ